MGHVDSLDAGTEDTCRCPECKCGHNKPANSAGGVDGWVADDTDDDVAVRVTAASLVTDLRCLTYKSITLLKLCAAELAKTGSDTHAGLDTALVMLTHDAKFLGVDFEPYNQTSLLSDALVVTDPTDTSN